MSPARAPYMDMNGRSKGLIMKSNSFACLHQQAAYEELCAGQPIYNNMPYEDDPLDNYEPFGVGNGYTGPPRHLNAAKRHSAPDGGGGGGASTAVGSPLTKCALNGSSLSSRSTSDSSESSRSGDVIYVSANAVKYSASKYGALMKREKILFVDHTKKYWAAVLSCTMYVYNGEKELKPCLVVNLEGYTARDAGANNRTKDWTFEVVCPGKKTYQFIAQNQNDMLSWIEAINNSSSKPSTPDILHSPSPTICFKQELLPTRELPVPPTTDHTSLDNCYDKPNPVIRAVNLYENAPDELDMESIYHFIDESKQEKDMLPKIDKQFWDGDTSYYNIPKSTPVPVLVKEDRNNNDYDDYFTEKETSYDIITNDSCEMNATTPALGVQQIIQKIEEINSKKMSPFLRRKSQSKSNSLMRNSTPPVYTTEDYYEPARVMKNMSNNVVVSSQSFRKCR
uniref:Src kinase-associated phosphoprotein 2-B n=2 Tax=Sipha flava TaxID=143950 RepID=A0A2S2QPA5_9HEMI